MKRQTIIFLAVLMFIAGINTVAQAQCNNTAGSYSVVNRKTYERVLDILFPRENSEPDKADFSFIIRFMPSSGAESQINIRKFEKSVSITESKSLSGNIYNRLNKILAETCKENAEEMAKRLKSKTKNISIPKAKAIEWHYKLLDSLNGTFNLIKQRSQKLERTREIGIVLDGTVYQLWYENAADEMKFEFYDEEIDDVRKTGYLPTVQWMNGIRQEIQKIK